MLSHVTPGAISASQFPTRGFDAMVSLLLGDRGLEKTLIVETLRDGDGDIRMEIQMTELLDCVTDRIGHDRHLLRNIIAHDHYR